MPHFLCPIRLQIAPLTKTSSTISNRGIIYLNRGNNMAKREKQRVVSKKHMARQEREALQIRYLTYGSIAILAIVVFLVGYALVSAYIITPNQPVATVNGEKISAKAYQARVKFDRYQLINQMISTANLMQSFGSDENTLAYFQNSIDQIRNQLTPEIHGQSIIDVMVNDTLIRQEAEKRGITVSDAEIDKFIQDAYGFYPDGTPTPAPTSASVPTSTLSPMQMTLVAPAATAVISPTAVFTPTEVAPTPTQAPEAVPTEVLPTPTAYTEDLFQENYQNSLTSYQQTIGLTEEEFRAIVSTEVWRNKLFDEITKDVPKEAQQIWARHILVATEEEAQAAIVRLDAGEDFAALAQELSTDTGSAANGGDLGWFGQGKMVPEFEQAAFALEIGQISAPVASSYGYHIIQVLGKEIRPLDSATFQQKQQTVFDDWLTAERAGADIQIYDSWGEVYPETPLIPDGL
ncbi:MAG TPA: hypothetical protein DEH25_12830 [Chloroflexi bacterium]|nr:hypothetical protein [Chloroflexota bacterium]